MTSRTNPSAAPHHGCGRPHRRLQAGNARRSSLRRCSPQAPSNVRFRGVVTRKQKRNKKKIERGRSEATSRAHARRVIPSLSRSDRASSPEPGCAADPKTKFLQRRAASERPMAGEGTSQPASFSAGTRAPSVGASALHRSARTDPLPFPPCSFFVGSSLSSRPGCSIASESFVRWLTRSPFSSRHTPPSKRDDATVPPPSSYFSRRCAGGQNGILFVTA